MAENGKKSPSLPQISQVPERTDWRQMKRRFKYLLIPCILIYSMLLTGCLDSLKKPSFSIDGTAIAVGTMTVQELIDAGFDIYDLSQRVEGGAFAPIDITGITIEPVTISSMIKYGKEGISYGYLSAANTDKNITALSECLIYEIDAAYEAAESIVLNEEDYQGLTPDELKEKLGDPYSDSIDSAIGSYISYEALNSKVFYQFGEDHTLNGIEVKFDYKTS